MSLNSITAIGILEEASSDHGCNWTEITKLDIATSFIDSKGTDFKTYVQGIAYQGYLDTKEVK